MLGIFMSMHSIKFVHSFIHSSSRIQSRSCIQASKFIHSIQLVHSIKFKHSIKFMHSINQFEKLLESTFILFSFIQASCCGDCMDSLFLNVIFQVRLG